MASISAAVDLPSEAIQRVLFIASNVHVYQIPPLKSTKGYVAADWTAPNTGARQIFTARLRIIETAIPQENESESLSTDILLEDPSNGELFAKAPYRDAKAVDPALDSARFFAVRIEGPTGERVVLGVGFEERGEAIDFSGALQEAKKVLGLEPPPKVKAAVKEEKKDYGLKQGETIKVDLGNMKRMRRKPNDENLGSDGGGGEKAALFSIKPPPASPSYSGNAGSGPLPSLAPPPTAQEVRAEKRRSRGYDLAPVPDKTSDTGFDDGEFGDFQ